MSKNGAEGHRIRVRERYFKEGMENFQPYEVVELLLHYSIPRHDTKPTAKRLIEKFGSLENILDAEPEILMECAGVGKRTALFFKLFGDVQKYRKKENMAQKEITCIEDAGRFAVNQLYGYDTEVCFIVLLDARRKIVAVEKLSEGIINSVDFNMKSLIELVTKYRKAVEILIMHNHPSGNKNPSGDDIRVTNHIEKILLPMQVTIFDHIIVVGDEYVSMRKRKFVSEIRE